MSFLNIFGASSASRATIPSYKQGEDHDSIDLQIKSLLYAFKRVQITKLAHFLNSSTNSFKYVDGIHNDDESQASYYQKLDSVYNIDGFKKEITNDEYRVMVDFSKNKFRSFCILSDYPSASLSRPSSPVKGGTVNEDISGDFPVFRDHKDRRVKTYRFILLPLEGVSLEFIANTLSTSDIYCEHFSTIDFPTRHQYAMDSIKKVLSTDKFDLKNKSKEITLTEDEKAAIIRQYLVTLAFNVQLSRIYEEYIKHHPLVKTPVSSPTRLKKTKSISNLSTPVKSLAPLVNLSLNISPSKTFLSSSSPKKLSPRKSVADLRSMRPESPTPGLRTKPSIAKIKLDELYNPVASPQGDPFFDSDASSTLSETSSVGNDKSASIPKRTTEIRLDVYEKCKAAIIDKLNRERALVSR
ncbi:uncharacterized protein RJT20DRAFT_130655 [Scheffersomyces xylosifermentans]|uniref:uncharacterized protein n=1 Tax=Scheffersomyces xylosifermentans TaxID=1304137 RepID=UPI00315D7D04